MSWFENQINELALPEIIINSIDHYLRELYFEQWQKKLISLHLEYYSFGYKMMVSDEVAIEWSDRPLLKRLINNGYDGNIYHIINNKIPVAFEYQDYVVGKIPARYKFSSGLNYPYGYA